MDVRKADPYLSYAMQDFAVPLGRSDREMRGDCHDRLLVRLREISESLGILKNVAENMSPGPFHNPQLTGDPAVAGGAPLKIVAGEAYSRIESSRGLLGCHVISDGSDRPARVHFRVPTLASLAVVPSVLVGARIEDLPVVLASLDLSLPEADR